MLAKFLLLLPLLSTPPGGIDWPQWRGANRDGVWKETGIVKKFAGPEIKVKWRAPIANGYSGPTVADGRVYVTDKLTDPKPVERIHCFNWDDTKHIPASILEASKSGPTQPQQQKPTNMTKKPMCDG